MVVAMACAGPACTLALPGTDRQCKTHAECAALGSGHVCARDGVCVALRTSERLVETTAGNECRESSQCAASQGLALCTDGRCLSLNDEDVGCISVGWGTVSPVDGAEVVPIGMLVPAEEIRDNPLRRVTGAVGTALRELDQARLAGGVRGLPALVGVACDEARPEAIDYLVHALHTRVIIGPTLARNLEPALELAGDEAVLFAPFADAPDLLPAPGDAPSWLVSCKPNRSHLRSYFLDAVAEARAQVEALAAPGMDPLVAALAVSGDAASVSFADGFDAERLRQSRLERIGYTSEGRGLGLLSALTQRASFPNFIVAASAEDDWQDNIAAVDGATYAAAQSYPYYFLADKRAALREQTIHESSTVDSFPRQYRRLLGLDYRRDAETKLAHATFANAFVLETGGGADPGLEYAYDCTYLGVYAMVAAALQFESLATTLSPPALVAGLAALQGGGPRLPVRALNIAATVEELVRRKGVAGSVDLIGASGALELSLAAQANAGGPSARQYYDGVAPDGELYCIDAVTADFCDTGIVFPAQGGPLQRLGNTCSCLMQ
jgi:hypothetical protein